MKNREFWEKLSKFVGKGESPSFVEKLTLDDGSIITNVLATSLLEEHRYSLSLMEKYDKECDYNRLLRKENFELMDYVSELEESINLFNGDGIEDEVNEYLMSTQGKCEEDNTYKS